MSPLLWRAGVRHLSRHPWQLALTVLGIALGVAVVLAIDLANESARRGFALFAETLAGRATHQIVGGPGGLPEAVYRRLRVEAGIHPAAPIVERDVIAAGSDHGTLHVLGIDPFAEAPFRAYTGRAGRLPGGDLAAFLTQPGSALVARDTLARLGLRPGDALAVLVGAERRGLRVVGTLEPGDALSARALQSLVVTDIATAQEVLGARGRLSRIDLIVPGPERAAAAALDRIGTLLPPDARVLPAGARGEALDRMTRALRLNLAALSLLALVVGMFLVYNAMTFSVVVRRELFGVLRALGVTRREIFALVLVEALGLGLLATAAGVPLGVVLGQGLVRLVARTVNDLYVTVTVTALSVPAVSLVKALALGLAGTLVATLPAAAEATGVTPRSAVARSVLESRARRGAPWAAAGGAVVALAGWAVLSVRTASVWPAYVGLFAVVLGAAMLAPAATLIAMTVMRPVLGRVAGVPGRLAAGHVVQGLSRTGVALAALTIAVSATVGVGVMIASFRSTVIRWLATSLPADVYVSAATPVSSRAEATLDPALIARIAAAPGVARVNRLRVARAESAAGPVQVLALDADDRGWSAFSLAAGDAASVAARVRYGGDVMASEPFASRHGLAIGARVELLTASGPRAFAVAAIHHDYGSSEGAVLMSRATYDRWWRDPAVTSLGVHARPGVDVDALVGRLRALAPADAGLLVRSNRALREGSLIVFDRTFAVTVVLRWLAVAVAFIGVLSAVTALALERGREVAVLRAQGLSRREVWALMTTQGALLGLVAGVLAIPVGLALAVVLVRVVNLRSFGWTLPLEVGPAVLLQAPLLAVAAALLASIYPAWRISRAPLPEALRDE
jgi:putative ABC transport system permease protein